MKGVAFDDLLGFLTKKMDSKAAAPKLARVVKVLGRTGSRYF